MFWDIYHNGHYLGRYLKERLSAAISEAAAHFRLPAWELEGYEVVG